MKAFEVKGEFMGSRRQWRPFSLEVASTDEDAAIQKTLALMGSRHKLKRKFIKIGGVRTLGAEEVTDSAVKHLLEAKR